MRRFTASCLFLPVGIVSVDISTRYWNRFTASTQDAPIVNSLKSSRAFLMEVNKLKMEYRTKPEPETRRLSLARIEMTPLENVQGCDIRTIAHLLGALVAIQAPPTSKHVKECGEWITKNAAESCLHPSAVIHAVFSMLILNKEAGLDALSMVMKTITVDQSLPVSAAAQLIFVASHSLNEKAQSLVEAAVIVLSGSSLEEVSLTDAARIIPVLAKKPAFSVLFDTVVSLVGSRISELPFTETVEILPILFRCSIPPAVLDSILRQIEDNISNQPMSPYVVSMVMRSSHFISSATRRVAIQKLCKESKDVPNLLSTSGAIQLFAAFGKESPNEVIDAIKALIPLNVSSIDVADISLLFQGFTITPELASTREAASQAVFSHFRKEGTFAHPDSAPLLCALVNLDMLESYQKEFQTVISACMDGCHWTLIECAMVATSLSKVRCKESRKLLREMAMKIGQQVHQASMRTVTEIVAAYGRAGVRNDVLCTAVSDKAIQFESTLSGHDLSTILAFLASVEFRNNRAFLELAERVKIMNSEYGPSQVSNLIAAYSKMLVWNFKLFHSLASRAADLAHLFTPTQIITVLTSIDRVDVRHPGLLLNLEGRVLDLLPVIDSRNAIPLLVSLSNSGLRNDVVFDALAEKVCLEVGALDAHQLGDVLMSFCRVGYLNHSIFQDVLLQVLAVAPTLPPLPMANISTAYATVGLKHEELFSIIAERTLMIRDQCPAVVLGSILAAVATVGIKNDKLFIEMITRVRHVPTYGNAQDIVNVVVAYSTVNVWHYRLFVRLADRAIQLRGEFRGRAIALLLNSFAKVEMKYDKLFTEFSPRIQACIATFEPSDMVMILGAYATLSIGDPAVFSVIGDRLAGVVSELSNADMKTVSESFDRVGITNNALAAALSVLPNPKA
eukprot:Tbor_TRINITY_DN553_c0_g1::TRINITY_DN553_c0_g1_i1::g.23332::m.23332